MNVSWEELLDIEDSYVTKIHDIKGFGWIVELEGNSKEAICPRSRTKIAKLTSESLFVCQRFANMWTRCMVAN